MKDDIKDKKILIPLDGSYKEFNKYKKAFKDKKIWNRFVFLIDNDLNKTEPNLKTQKYIRMIALRN